jgi:ABC-type multidrug transport system permease subunit
MNTLLIIVGGFIGLSIAFSAIGKIKRIPGAIEAIAHVGVKEKQYNQLALLEILGSLGLFVGIWIKSIGVAAAIGITLYFVGALFAHLRIKDKFSKMLPALFLLLISVVTLILELKR